MSDFEAFLQDLRRAEDPAGALAAVARARAAREQQHRHEPDAIGERATGGAGDADGMNDRYDASLCRMEYYTDPDRGSRRYTPLFQLVPAPSSLLPGGPTLYLYGGLGYGSCFYDSICMLFNVGGYADAARAHDQTTMKRIVSEFRCSFMKNMSLDRWREFLREELRETPMSHTWRDVVQERMGDTQNDLHEDFCRVDNWATEATARYLARELRVTIYIIDTKTWSAFCGVHGVDDSFPAIIIFWERNTHFTPAFIVSSSDSDGSSTTLRLQGVITDPALKARIKRQYETTWCRCSEASSPCYRPGAPTNR